MKVPPPLPLNPASVKQSRDSRAIADCRYRHWTGRKHIAGPHCWCDPELDEPGLYVHHDMEETMPSNSAKQARTMRAAAHDKTFAKKIGIPQKVARDFVEADKKKGRKK